MRSLFFLLFMLLLFLPASAFAQSIVDTGDVVVDGDNNLIVGSTAPGSRLIDGADDGPYANVDIGSALVFPTPSSIVVDNGGSLTSLGDLSLSVPDQTSTEAGFAELTILSDSHVETDGLLIGERGSNSGAAIVRIEDGGTLHSSSAEIFSLGAVWASSISVVGSGSSWISDGGVGISGDLGEVSISIEDGGYARFGSYSFGGTYLQPATLSVIGSGSIVDTGGMVLGSTGNAVEILNGGVMNSADVSMFSRSITGASVQGDGSRWNIDGALSVRGFDGESFISVSGGASLSSRETWMDGGQVWISGEGSTWSSGALSLQSDILYPSRVSVTGGGLLFSDAVSFSGCASDGFGYSPSCSIRVDGPGSRWISNGPVTASATEMRLSTIDITDRALAVIRDKVTIGNNSQLNLDNGGFIANKITIAGGELRGTGVINGDVVNSGRVAVGDTATGDIGGIVIKGDYIQEDGASLDIQLGGASPLDSDVLVVLGTSVLDGELTITLAEGYLPEHGDTFYVVAATQRLGEFDFVSGFDLGNGLTLDLSYTQHFAMLRTVDENWVGPSAPEPGAALLFAVGFFVVRRAARRKAASIL
jgi:hypothetical protein